MNETIQSKRERKKCVYNTKWSCCVFNIFILIGQAVAWKYLSFTDGIKRIKSHCTILIFLSSSTCTHVIVVSKNDTNNNNETDGSEWLIVVVVVSLDAHCSNTLSLSIPLALSSTRFYYWVYAQSFNTITPTNKRAMWEIDGHGNQNILFYISYRLTFLKIISMYKKKKLQDNERPLYTQLTSYSAILFFFCSLKFARQETNKLEKEKEIRTNDYCTKYSTGSR